MLSCRDVSTLLATDALERAPWPRRMSVRLHLMMCRHCRRYEVQLSAIGEAARDLWGTLGADHAAEMRIESAAIARAEELRNQSE